MEKVKLLKVFIASPSDLKKERAAACRFIDSFELPGVIFKSVIWERDLPRTSQRSSQALINETLLPDADILVALFATKIGTKTEHADSGTVEEIDTFTAYNKPVILYFVRKKLSSTEITNESLEDLQNVNNLKDKYKDDIIYDKIDKSGLASALKRDITYHANQILSLTPSNKAKRGISQKALAKNRPSSQKSTVNKNDTQLKAPWYMDSIADLINNSLKENGVSFHYKDNLTFHENLQFLTGTTNYTALLEKQRLEGARIDAFNFKYGNYDYSEDLRALFPQWGKQIYGRISKLNPDFDSKPFRVLSIGGNDGSELRSIFTNFHNASCTVVDISDVAIDKGRAQFPEMEFIQNDMEQEYLNNVDPFDICLCLRAIQSRGVFSHNALIQMCKHLNKNGILIISIPNGYKHNEKVERGLYDHRSRTFLRTKPPELATKIERKLMDYRFIETGIETIDTEIIIWGKGQND